MTIDEAVEKLKKKMATQWSEKEKANEQMVLKQYGGIFKKENIHKLTKEQFLSFLTFKGKYGYCGNRHWHYISRYSSRITRDMTKLRRVLEELLDERKDISIRLRSAKQIKGFGRATLTPILYVSNPEKYGIFNHQTKMGMINTELYPEGMQKAPSYEVYPAVNKILHNLQDKYNLSFWFIDCLWPLINKQVGKPRTVKKQTKVKELTEPFDIQNILDYEIKRVKDYCAGRLEIEDMVELCFLLWFCYKFRLYYEGSIIFRKINKNSIPEDFYRVVEKIGLVCEDKE